MIPELKTFLIAMSPIIELRGAIPMALKAYNLPLWEAYVLSVAGNLVPLWGIVFLGKPIAGFLSEKHLCFKKFFDWLFLKVGKKANLLLGKMGCNLTVLVLTALPIPLVGGWTGAIASFILEVPAKKGAQLVFFGTLISGLIVSLLTLGIINFVN